MLTKQLFRLRTSSETGGFLPISVIIKPCSSPLCWFSCSGHWYWKRDICTWLNNHIGKYQSFYLGRRQIFTLSRKNAYTARLAWEHTEIYPDYRREISWQQCVGCNSILCDGQGLCRFRGLVSYKYCRCIFCHTGKIHLTV
mgnify:CR=1 FL=1